MAVILIENVNDKREPVRRILIIGNHSLMGAGIESLLLQKPHFDVSGISPTDEMTLVQEIGQYQPDVIVIDDAIPVTNTIRLLSLLRSYPRLRMVRVSSEDDLVRIYDIFQYLITQADDLVALIARVSELNAYQSHPGKEEAK